jgi:hypothetical protein
MDGAGLINVDDLGFSYELDLRGTKGADEIRIDPQTNGDWKVVIRDRENPKTIHAQQTIPASQVKNIGHVYVAAGEGNDLVDLSKLSGDFFAIVHGNGGDDTLKGTQGPDLINGGKGSDTIEGNQGKDLLLGDGTAKRGDLSKMEQFQKAIRVKTNPYFAERHFVRKFAKGGGTGNDDVDGGDDHDLILTGAGCDTLKGGSNAKDATKDDGDKDILVGGTGGDNFQGGTNDKLVATKKEKAEATLVSPKGKYPQQSGSPAMACRAGNDTHGTPEGKLVGKLGIEGTSGQNEGTSVDAQLAASADEFFAELGSGFGLANDHQTDQSLKGTAIVPTIDMSKLSYRQGVDTFFKNFGALDDGDSPDQPDQNRRDVPRIGAPTTDLLPSPLGPLLDAETEARIRELLNGDNPLDAYREAAWARFARTPESPAELVRGYRPVGYETVTDPFFEDVFPTPTSNGAFGDTPDQKDGEEIL